MCVVAVFVNAILGLPSWMGRRRRLKRSPTSCCSSVTGWDKGPGRLPAMNQACDLTFHTTFFGLLHGRQKEEHVLCTAQEVIAFALQPTRSLFRSCCRVRRSARFGESGSLRLFSAVRHGCICIVSSQRCPTWNGETHDFLECLCF